MVLTAGGTYEVLLEDLERAGTGRRRERAIKDTIKHCITASPTRTAL